MNSLQQRQQQQLYNQKFEKALDSIIMSWDNVLKNWYPYAMKALEFSSIPRLGIHPLKYNDFFKEDVHGINMNTVGRLCNNLEERTPREMEVSPRRWAEILAMNEEVGRQWNALAEPVRQKLDRELQIMSNKASGLGIIKAEA